MSLHPGTAEPWSTIPCEAMQFCSAAKPGALGHGHSWMTHGFIRTIAGPDKQAGFGRVRRRAADIRWLLMKIRVKQSCLVGSVHTMSRWEIPGYSMVAGDS